jgi:hypothetical protein
MKIYVDKEIRCEFEDKYTRHLIYSNDGIYCNQKNKLTQIVYQDLSEEIIYKNYKFYIDKTTETFGDVITHIPYDHLYCEETYEKKNIGYDIYYVKCSYFDQTIYYFEMTTVSDLYLDMMISFLSIE